MMQPEDVKRIFKTPVSLCTKCDLAYRCKERAKKGGPVTFCRLYAPKHGGAQ